MESRRIVLQDNMVVPARSECIVEANTVYADLTIRSCNWASTPMRIMSGLYVARSLVADQSHGVQVRVVNVANDDAALEKGTHLGYFEEVAVYPSETASEVEPTNGMDHLKSVFNTVDETITDKDRDELWLLLQEYASVFSKSEYDLGRATAVQHTIDTGTNKSVRQPLRRQPIHLTSVMDDQLQAMLDQGIIRPSRLD